MLRWVYLMDRPRVDQSEAERANRLHLHHFLWKTLFTLVFLKERAVCGKVALDA